MWNIAIIFLVWMIAAICFLVMKKIQPDEARLYLVYVTFVCVAFTAVVAYHLFVK